LAKQLAEVDTVLFCDLYNIKTEQGTKLDLLSHLFLYDIYVDWTPKQVILKAAQIGFSTMAIIKSLWAARNKGLDIIYTLPTSNDINDFVGGKVNRIIEQNPILKEYVRDRDTIEQKKVGNNVIYYRGTWTQKAALMVSSDLNIFDEEDRSKQDVIAQYASRLQHSKYKWEWHFSNPSVEGNGVSRYWAQSDQKNWHIKCKGCDTQQVMSWPESIDQKKKIYVCKHCSKELTNEERRKGDWIAKYPGREWSGYWIPLFIAPWVSAQQICEYYETKSIEYFHNFVLGLPYVGEGNTVVPDVILRNLTSAINQQQKVVIGCDSGQKKHYVIGNAQGLFYYGVTESWETIEELLKRYPRSIAVVDALPDLTEPRKLREKYPGRVYLCHYVKDRKTLQLIKWGQGDEWGNVKADRNRLIQVVIDEFADRRVPLQGTQDDWADYVKHWKTLYRVVVQDILGAPQFRWLTSDGNDHWVHATAYWRVGMARFAEEAQLFDANKTIFQTAPEISVHGTISHNPLQYQHEEREEDWRNV